MKTLLPLILLFALCGCSPNERAASSMFNRNAKFKLTLYSASGVVIKSWNTDYPAIQASNGYTYFVDSSTGLNVEINGTIISEQVKEETK